MTRKPAHRSMGRLHGTASGLAAVPLAIALFLPAAPAEANWLGRGMGVAGAARALKENLGESIDLLGDTLGAAVKGDVGRSRGSRVRSGRFREGSSWTPFRL